MKLRKMMDQLEEDRYWEQQSMIDEYHRDWRECERSNITNYRAGLFLGTLIGVLFGYLMMLSL